MSVSLVYLLFNRITVIYYDDNGNVDLACKIDSIIDFRSAKFYSLIFVKNEAIRPRDETSGFLYG